MINEHAPEVADQEFTIAENSPQGTLIGEVIATDQDEGQSVSFEIIDGNLDATFKINPNSGLLSVDNPSKLDYESTIELLISVSVSDSHEKDPLESSASVKIKLTDKNEFAPAFEAPTFQVDENPLNGKVIGVIEASDQDTHQSLIYSIKTPEAAAYVEIDPSSGSLSVLDSSIFDYESTQQLVFEVEVKDDHENSKSAAKSVTLNIRNVTEITDGLLAYFPFNGNSDDESSNQVSSSNIGADLAEDRFGNPNSAYLLDGFKDFIQINGNYPIILSKTFSYSIWAMVNGKSGSSLASNSLFEQRDDADGGAPVFIHFNADQEGETRLVLRSSAEVEHVKIGTPAPEYGSWHHYVITLDIDKNMKLYIDGELKVSGTFINDGDFHTNVNRVSIGAHHPGGSITGAFNGALDGVLIHDRALSGSEVESLYQNADY